MNEKRSFAYRVTSTDALESLRKMNLRSLPAGLPSDELGINSWVFYCKCSCQFFVSSKENAIYYGFKIACPVCGNDDFLELSHSPASICSDSKLECFEDKYVASRVLLKAGINRYSGQVYTSLERKRAVFNKETRMVYFLTSQNGAPYKVSGYSYRYHNLYITSDDMKKLIEAYNRDFPEWRISIKNMVFNDFVKIFKNPQLVNVINVYGEQAFRCISIRMNEFSFKPSSVGNFKIVSHRPVDIFKELFGKEMTKCALKNFKSMNNTYLIEYCNVVRLVGIDNALKLLRNYNERQFYFCRHILTRFMEECGDATVATNRLLSYSQEELVRARSMIVDAFDFRKEYGDVPGMENYLNLKFSLMSYEEIVRVHDEMNFLIDSFLMQEDEESFQRIQKDFAHLEFKGEKYNLIVPKRASDIVAEGRSMNHCVGTYVRSIINGDCFIFFVRDKDDNRMATVEVSDSHICQIKSKFNARPSDEVIDFVIDWGKKHGFEYVGW